MKISHVLYMLFSFPILVVGWIYAALGIYYLGGSLLEYPTNEENNSLAAVWTFLFSFGVISVAGFLAAQAKFASNNSIRKIYKYSIIVSSALFLGYIIIGMIVALFVNQ